MPARIAQSENIFPNPLHKSESDLSTAFNIGFRHVRSPSTFQPARNRYDRRYESRIDDSLMVFGHLGTGICTSALEILTVYI